MTSFTGDESPLQAEDWLEEVKGMTTLNRWPFEYVLQYVRMHLTGPAKDWFTGREFSDWRELERKFCLVFVRDACAADREDEMRARKQGSNETLILYMQPKLRMCRGIGHTFAVSKDYVLRGLRSKEMALYAVVRTHAGEEDLLGDLLNWERMSSLHASAVVPKYVAPQNARGAPVRPLPKKKTEEKANPNKWKKFFKTVVEASGSNREASFSSCWVCKKSGHLSHDCPDKVSRKPVCFGCGVEGHIRPNCPERNQTNFAEVRTVTSSHPYNKSNLNRHLKNVHAVVRARPQRGEIEIASNIVVPDLAAGPSKQTSNVNNNMLNDYFSDGYDEMLAEVPENYQGDTAVARVRPQRGEIEIAPNIIVSDLPAGPSNQTQNVNDMDDFNDRNDVCGNA
ncbi:uncharacterized protein LOC132939392 [Metopolophium dirhodum]|uniref:uncharacterized protein LOC132939392 n=1 Tax=Metopolophium dirhodum TaxID=44670 RepID=UPI00299042C5|nr:uncharacterized protein LOC132939392 [Metopolophium dirhodum]XP_060862510.1 uncharacterized protein LOC132939392 [Metopolophium dirhodum]